MTSTATQTAVVLSGLRAIVTSRVFKAPPQRVFEVWTKPDFVRQWWSPKSHGTTMTECTVDLRPGGTYRYVLKQGRRTVSFGGIYRQVESPSRLVSSQRYEQSPMAGEAIITVTFAPDGEHTRLTSHEEYPTPKIRKLVIDSGMERGMRETMDQLAALLESPFAVE